ncbi:germination protein YpeB [Sporolactobacillus sp. CPB3-1]|uniref:Germination protein YpeB n=1 Tax=Sporolactobacillus mangiferae TaxID=2940498 RepID=A0ABT0MAE8_9BACL|nr:germination protein YpeB [Sporolactobacillus mangiferae]MCL1631846.1 germination protein YpeB [Sporolactobacillus mangiferae]
MKRRDWIALLSVAVAVLLIGIGTWGYREYQLRKTVMIDAENHYQQAYHELTYYVDSLEESLGMALAMQSRESMRPQLVETWRLSTLAHAAANELPLTLLPFNRTNEFLAHVGEFTYNSGVKAIKDRSLTNNEYKNLRELYSESQKIRDELRSVQSKVMAEHLRWMDVETALKSQNENRDNQVIDGMKRINMQATDYTDSFSPENPRNAVLEKKRINPITGEQISRNQAISQLRKWIDRPDAKLKKISETGKGSYIPAYEITLSEHGRSLNAAVTRKGGHVVWFLRERSIQKEKFNLYEASQKSIAFLKKHQFKDLELTKRNKYNNIAAFTYVLRKKNIRFYPASIKVKIALDNGEILGFDQSDYLYNKRDYIPMKPAISEDEARKQLNHDLKVQETGLAVIQNQSLNNVLCYEFYATRDNDTYRVLLNAKSGDQEKIELLKE